MYVGIGEDLGEVLRRQIEHAEPIHHRVGVRQRAQEQHDDGVDDEKGQGQHDARRP